MKFSIIVVAISFFHDHIKAANVPALNSEFPKGLKLEAINSSKNIQWDMRDLAVSLNSCLHTMNRFIDSIGGEAKFNEHLEEGKSKIGR
jgi:hypothetical protein